MHSGSRYILSIGAGIGCLGLVYFLSLVAGLPFWLIVPIAIAAIYFLTKWINPKGIANDEGGSRFALYILIACVFILTNKAYYIATKYGPWDAWAIWNFHAAYLADGAHWKNMLLNKNGAHPDYPLALPSVIGFFNRLVQQTHNLLIPYAFHFLITLLIPILIYLETYRKSIFIAALCLLLFATNEFYIMQGTYHLADTLLAFFLLCTLVCMSYAEQDKRMLALSAAFLGLCMWTKNEGFIIASIFTLFHLKELFATGRLKYSLAGIAAPLLVWLLYKLAYAPPNDMVEGQSGHTMQLLLQPSRYKLIWDSFVNNLQYFRDVKYAVAIYILICAIRWRMPDKRMLMVLAILLAYMMVYVVSPHHLEWHLFTSQSRLMHQLMPAAMYIAALKFAGESVGPGFQARFFSTRQRPQ